MANIYSEQLKQIYIILTWIVTAVTKVLKISIKCLGPSLFFLYWRTVYVGPNDLMPFHGHSLKHESHFSVFIILLEKLSLF